MRRMALLLLALTVLSTKAGAQSTAMPARGSWGGELCFSCGVTLLKFRDTTAAWLLGVNGQFTRIRVEQNGVPVTSPDDQLLATLRLGHRWYGKGSTQFRPFYSLAGTIGVDGGNSFDGLVYGGTGNLGGAWFFTPHLSLGTAGVLDVLHREFEDQAGTFTIRQRMWTASLSINLMASVFF